MVHDFLQRSNYRSPNSPQDAELRRKLTSEISSWTATVGPQMLGKMVETSCSYAETAYSHVSFDHRYYIALYTACMLYGEDLGSRDPAAIAQFARRLISGRPQLSPIFDRLGDLLRDAHLYWTDVGADAIISSTLDALTATFVEFATSEMEIAPAATRYPYYLRTRAGGGPQFTHFMFMRSWRETPDSYLQIIPYVTAPLASSQHLTLIMMQGS